MKKVTACFINELYELYEESGAPYDVDHSFTSYEELCNFCEDNDLDLTNVTNLDDEDNPSYIVCWVTKKVTPQKYGDLVEHTDHYKVFTDAVFNMNAAMNFYNGLVEEEDTYSANVCQVIRSTDYAC